jgi:putative methyltransferase (TIGR04325 family)
MLKRLKQTTRTAANLVAKRHLIRRTGALTGAYPDRESALRAAPRRALSGYCHDAVVGVSVEHMSAMREWDYPVLFWLDRLLRERPDTRLRLLDAGGHVGTKFRAFRERIDVSRIDWLVYDLPPMVAAGRVAAERDGLTDSLRFTDDISTAGAPDVLLCSGLLQYLDEPFASFVRRMPAPPPIVLLNKVALREGPSVVALERIGPSYVPYQVRGRQGFASELAGLGYSVEDTWEITALSRRIDSHPELGASESRGFMLRAARAAA